MMTESSSSATTASALPAGAAVPAAYHHGDNLLVRNSHDDDDDDDDDDDKHRPPPQDVVQAGGEPAFEQAPSPPAATNSSPKKKKKNKKGKKKAAAAEAAAHATLKVLESTTSSPPEVVMMARALQVPTADTGSHHPPTTKDEPSPRKDDNVDAKNGVPVVVDDDDNGAVSHNTAKGWADGDAKKGSSTTTTNSHSSSHNNSFKSETASMTSAMTEYRLFDGGNLSSSSPRLDGALPYLEKESSKNPTSNNPTTVWSSMKLATAATAAAAASQKASASSAAAATSSRRVDMGHPFVMVPPPPSSAVGSSPRLDHPRHYQRPPPPDLGIKEPGGGGGDVVAVPEATPRHLKGMNDGTYSDKWSSNDVIDKDAYMNNLDNDNDDDLDEASDIKSTSVSHRSLCTGMSVTVASSGLESSHYCDDEIYKLVTPFSTGNPHVMKDKDFGESKDGMNKGNSKGDPQSAPPPALVATKSASSDRAGAWGSKEVVTPTTISGDGPVRNRMAHGPLASSGEIVVHPEELMPPELYRPAPGPANLVGGSREELEDAVAASGGAAREIVFEPPPVEALDEEEGTEKDVDEDHDDLHLDHVSAHSSPSAMRNYFLDHLTSPISPRRHSGEVDVGLLDTNSEGEEVPVASMNETWCKGLPLSAALLPSSDDDDASDVQSEISDLSDDRSNAYIGLDAALASAKQVYGFNGQPASPKAVHRPTIATSHMVTPTSPGGAHGGEMTYEPSVPLFPSTRPTQHHRGSKGTMLRKAASLRALPIQSEPHNDALKADSAFEPTTPSFNAPARPPTVVHGHRDVRHSHPSMRAFRSKSQRSVYSTASQQSVEIHLDIYVSPIMEDSQALEGLPDRPYVPAELSNSRKQPSSSRGKNRFRRWTSFRSGRSSSTKDMHQSRRRSKKNAALRLPMLNINATDEDSNASSQESHLDDIDELEDHLQIEYANEENVLNKGYEERHDLYEKDFLTCPLDDVQARFENRNKAMPETHPDFLTEAQRTCCANLKRRWAEKYPKLPLSDDMILRFALCAPRGLFHEASAWKKMKRFDRRYLTLTAAGMEKQLRTKTLFPLPGVETKEGNACFYMRPSRYFPKETSVTEIIDNQCYVMSTMMEVEQNARNGIGFIANMDNWQFVNFEVKYCFCFMMALQNCAVPTKVTHFLIVNPPSWFGKIWAIMKTMLAPSFQKKVKMIPERYLNLYLKPGFEENLPDEMESGLADMDDIVLEFLADRKRIEKEMSMSSGGAGAVSAAPVSSTRERSATRVK